MTRTLLLTCAVLLCGCSQDAGTPSSSQQPISSTAKEALIAHSAEFKPQVYKVTDGVYQAVGYALANVIMIEGSDGVIIVDTTESVETAKIIKAEFDKITTKPVKAIIYTHNHADHIFGARGFAPDDNVAVYAHKSTEYYINRFINVLRPVLSSRSMKMFGNFLPEGEDGVINDGIGPYLATGHGRAGTLGLIRPTVTVDEELDVEIAGVKLKLVHAPGETNDQLFVWLPDSRTLLPGDNIYKSFPNLYTIRGTPYRDVLEWSASIDRIMSFKPHNLAPSHTRPILGEDNVKQVLTAYRDAIQYVHDQTIRGINQGYTPDQLVSMIELPAHLKNHPFLQEFYGTVDWSVRSVFSGYLGWFDGNGSNLNPIPPQQRGERIIALAGGDQAFLQEIRATLDSGDYQWAAELSDFMINADRETAKAKSLKAEAFRGLGQQTGNPNARNWYLTQALELDGLVPPPEEISESAREFLASLPIEGIMESLAVNLDAEKSIDLLLSVNFNFTDTDEQFNVLVRHGVAVVTRQLDPQADLKLELATNVWKEIVTGQRGVPGSLASNDLRLENGVRDIPQLLEFLLLFRPPESV